ncbi:MAG: NosD domain-containing protein, partial [Euryarchaeota archaeon]|nr:NosD domain-containing protein [Euryarchaeota archaeon]
LTENNASKNDYGIRLWNSSDNTLTENNASDNWYGIYLHSSSNNTLASNAMSGNNYNFDVSGDSLSHYIQKIDTGNIVDGKPIYYWVDQRDKQIPGDAGFVGVANSTNITVRDLTLTKNHAGVLFAYTENSRIENVTASDNRCGICLRSSSNNILSDNKAAKNYYGIRLWNSSDNTLTENNASKNWWCGIRLDHSSNNLLTNNTASNNRYGIRLWNSSDNTLTENNASENWYGDGIYLYFSGNNALTENNASKNDCGICLWYSNNNTLTDNIASNNDYRGIRLLYSGNNTLASNTISGNEYNFDVTGDSLSHYIQKIDTGNIVDGKPIYYWVDQRDKQIPGDAGFVGVVNSTNITVRDLTLTKNHEGVLFAYTENSRIENVTASDNGEGIYLRSSNKNTLTGNTASDNQCGIYLRSSNKNTFTGNTASDNCCGIYLRYSGNNTLASNTASDNDHGIGMYSSGNNTLYHNNLINSRWRNAYDTGTNQWDSGAEGNYYSNYNGADPDGDGISNTPYQIPGGASIDHFPLMQPWTATGAEWHVYPGAGTPIQTAIDGAEPGDTIYVHAGEYCENVGVGKRLTLIGDGADVVTVRAADAGGHVFEVTADWIYISGFAVTRTTRPWSAAGIYLGSDVDHCNISDNDASNNTCGIWLEDS